MIEQLEKVGVDVAIVPERTDADGIIEKIVCIAGLIDAPEEALKAALADLQEDYEFLKANTFDSDSSCRPFIPSGWSSYGWWSGTSADGVMKMAGLNNVFGSFDGWKPVASESMVEKSQNIYLCPLEVWR